MPEYKKIGPKKWLKVSADYIVPWYYDSEVDGKGRILKQNCKEQKYHEIVISERRPD